MSDLFRIGDLKRGARVSLRECDCEGKYEHDGPGTALVRVERTCGSHWLMQGTLLPMRPGDMVRCDPLVAVA
jgi:hypothetical protein